jgi:hypothetical protein
MLVKILLGKPLRESGAETFALFNKSVSLFGRLTHDRNRNVSVALQATGIVIVEKLLNCSYQIGVWHRPGIDEEHELFAIAKTIFHSRMTVRRKSMIFFDRAPPDSHLSQAGTSKVSLKMPSHDSLHRSESAEEFHQRKSTNGEITCRACLHRHSECIDRVIFKNNHLHEEDCDAGVLRITR